MTFVLQNQLEDRVKDCSLGILVMEQVENDGSTPEFQSAKLEIEREIQRKYGAAARTELKDLHPMNVYISYYRKFGYTYHVLPQLESIARGKSIASGLPLVEAMFMAELKNMLLTAGHDLQKLKLPPTLLAATGEESYTSLSGKEVKTTGGDIMLADQDGVISSILKGPDLRTRIDKQTREVIYTTYAPAGIQEEIISQHLDDIEAYVRLLSSESAPRWKHVEHY